MSSPPETPAPQPAPPGPPPGYAASPPGPPYPPYPWYPPAPRDNTALIIVILVVLVILVPVVLAAVLYFMVSGLISGPGGSKPLVTFSGVTNVNSMTWTFSVVSAQPAVAWSNYKVNFGIGQSIGTAVNLAASGVKAIVTVTGPSPASVNVSWDDVGGGGLLSGGDIFTIGFPSAPAAGTSLTFYLLYLDGSLIATRTWQAEPGGSKPVVTFGAVTKVNAVTWQFSISSAQPAVASSNYKVNFAIGTNIGTAVNMGASDVNTTVTVTGATPSSVGVKWTDIGGSGQVKNGDIITIAFPSAPAASTYLTFYLLYSDGSQIQSQSWQA